ncbi:TetR/AcrR family transcriptional regulator [Williamsia sp. CHRR-6]|uniref:TetR/AcrR family transcriptional regulator n=1 Tax=Williamsia sp. CHRR-6 TaxID=2835871 RepID=UPI001BDB311A|nr:TetR family transcriptional regulator [Williamsia sp. CHRR-6]MBT0566881.1 TetR family transcriptional regulator [Williamsia sp. CHRR-6]
MGPMTSAPTPKGERRRMKLIAAAGDLLLENGFDAVRHRAVAERAGLPLASTTYYFASLEELIVEAVRHVCERDQLAIAARSESVTRRRRGCEATAEALADVFIGDRTRRDALAARYEMVVAAARTPRLQPLVAEHRSKLAGWHCAVLAKSGRAGDPGAVSALMAVEDGVVVGALAADTGDVVGAARHALAEVLDVLAPPQNAGVAII